MSEQAGGLTALWNLRRDCWRNQFRPVCIRTWPELLKDPRSKGWSEFARQDPPHPAVDLPPDANAQSTGILCDGLQYIDIDLHDRDACYATADYCLTNFGDAPIRFRRNAPRMGLLY